MMYKIQVHGEHASPKYLAEYESEVVPMAGDTYAGISFEDKRQRTVINRQLFAFTSNIISVYTKLSFPETN